MRIVITPNMLTNRNQIKLGSLLVENVRSFSADFAKAFSIQNEYVAKHYYIVADVIRSDRKVIEYKIKLLHVESNGNVYQELQRSIYLPRYGKMQSKKYLNFSVLSY